MAVAVLPLTVILFFNLYSIRLAREHEVHGEAFQTGQLAALEMQRVLGGLENTLMAMAAAPAVQSLDPIACNDYMQRVGARLPQFAGIAVLDAFGIIRCRQEPRGIGVSLADRSYIKEAMAARFSVGEYTVGRVSDQKVLPVSVPVTGDNGKVIGVVAGSLDLGWLDKKVRERTFALDSSLTIADRDGVVLAHYPDPERFVGKPLPDEYKSVTRADQPGTLELTSPDGPLRIVAYFPPSPNQPGLFIAVGISTAAEYAAVTHAVYYGAAGALLAGALALGVASLIGRYSIRRPVQHMLNTVAAWRSRDENARTGMSASNGEFGQLGAAIDAYMNELVAARQLRRKDEERRNVLMRELDHRVKNLLTTVQAVARQSLRSSGLDHSVSETFTQRLAAMGEAHSLLMKDDWQSAALEDVVRTAVGPFDLAVPSRFSIAGPSILINSQASLALGMALHELCTNAVKYGALKTDEGVVQIRWAIDDDATRTLVFGWEEIGGPPVARSERSGFGSTMIERMLGSQIGGEVDVRYDPEGLKFCLRVSAAKVEHEPASA